MSYKIRFSISGATQPFISSVNQRFIECELLLPFNSETKMLALNLLHKHFSKAKIEKVQGNSSYQAAPELDHNDQDLCPERTKT